MVLNGYKENFNFNTGNFLKRFQILIEILLETKNAILTYKTLNQIRLLVDSND